MGFGEIGGNRKTDLYPNVQIHADQIRVYRYRRCAINRHNFVRLHVVFRPGGYLEYVVMRHDGFPCKNCAFDLFLRREVLWSGIRFELLTARELKFRVVSRGDGVAYSLHRSQLQQV
jgi:hypothetical protein